MVTVASGFETSIFESVAVVSIIAILVAFFVAYGVRSRHRREYVRDRIGLERYRELIHLHNLTPSEQHVIQQMASTLKRPRDAYRLMERQGWFNQAAIQLLDQNEITAAQVSGLRIKLGFTGRLIGTQPQSSVDIPVESAITVEYPRGARLEGIVTASASNALRVRLEDEDTPLPPGTRAHVEYRNEAGVFTFDTVVLIREGEDALLQHSERIEKRQQRRYYRRAMRLPIRVSRQLSEEEPEETELLDLGGGGASIRNPATRYERGDILKLVLPTDDGEVLQLPAMVIRTSRGRTVLHLRYGNIRESQRDRIYRMLFYTS
ncbi:MAG: PilZ domain-containing protein [Alkalispirochaeta sp.]